MSAVYSTWEVNKVIAEELVRNIILALVAVVLMTLLLIANFITSATVFACVVMTLVGIEIADDVPHNDDTSGFGSISQHVI